MVILALTIFLVVAIIAIVPLVYWLTKDVDDYDWREDD